jgi:glycosyltransferase involved in cell wall biosynthesis
MAGIETEFEIVLVDDGSYDETLSLARLAAEQWSNVRVIGYPENLGKGYALVEGAREAKGDLILFVDADLEVHPRQLALLYGVLIGLDADVVIGSKLHRSSTISYPLKRRVLSVGYYLLVRLMFRLPIHDTQTGLKLYKAEVLRRVAGRLLVKRFAFDLEALANADRLGYRIAEAPVVVTRERPFPRVGRGDVLHVAWDTAAIWYRMHLRRWYDKVGVEADAKAAAGEVAMAPGGAPALARELERAEPSALRKRSERSAGRGSGER